MKMTKEDLVRKNQPSPTEDVQTATELKCILESLDQIDNLVHRNIGLVTTSSLENARELKQKVHGFTATIRNYIKIWDSRDTEYREIYRGWFNDKVDKEALYEDKIKRLDFTFPPNLT